MRVSREVPLKWARLLLPAVLLSLAACGGDETPAPEGVLSEPDVVRLDPAQVRAAGIRTATVESGDVRREVQVPGSVQPPDTAYAVVGSIVEGRVVAVHVLPGDVVRAGDPLVEIHAHELAEAERDLTAARADLVYRENALRRSEELLQAGAVSLEEVERRTSEVASARADVRRAEELLEHLVPSPAGNVTAAAPRDGTVFEVQARMGQAVLPGTPVVTMGRTDVLWVTAFVPEQTASALGTGDTVRVRFGVPDLEVRAHLVRAGNFIDPSNRSVEMRFELDEIPAGVRAGSFAVVSVTTSDLLHGVILDDEAAVRLGERDVVFVAEAPGVYRAVTVEVVPTGAGRVAVVGAPEGADLVVEGAYFLKSALELSVEAAEAEAEAATGGAP
jgi:RND family efflux transporter MFP subunit